MSKEPEPEGKTDESKDPETDPNDLSPADVKIILLGDSAVGKTKLVERFLMDEYNPQQLWSSPCRGRNTPRCIF